MFGWVVIFTGLGDSLSVFLACIHAVGIASPKLGLKLYNRGVAYAYVGALYDVNCPAMFGKGFVLEREVF